MALQPFSWGAGGEKASPSRVKKYADIAEALASKSGSPKTFGEGLNRIGEALLHNSYQAKAAAGEEEGAAARKAVMDALMGNADPTMADIGGALGNEWVTSDPGSSAIVQALLGQEMQQNDPLRQQQLQMGQIELENARNPQPEPGFSLLAPEEALTLGLPEGGAYQKGPDGKIYEIGGGGTNVNVNTGDGAPGLGKLSTDFGYVLDAEGNPKIDPVTGLPTAAAIPGSPAAIEAANLAAKAGLSEGRKDVSTDVITTAASIARDLAAKPGNTGMTGAVLANLSETEAAELRRQVGVLTANATIENLTAMRQASPTGGALGAVSDRENAMLAAAAGAIDPNASGPDFQRALDNYEKVLLQIVHGPEEGERLFQETRASTGNNPADPKYSGETPPEGWGGEPELWKFMSPEDRALW